MRKIKDENISRYKQRSWFLPSAAFPIALMFNDAQISLHYNLKHYDLQLRL